MIDRVEQQRRGQSPRKTSTKHPYAAVEHRVIDSPAYAALKPSAKVLLLLMARQLTKSNNGHLQATFEWCKRYGIGSEHTLRDAIAELIAHGLIYRTKSHGANRVWANYAVTWLPIPDKGGLFLDGWKQLAWRDWLPDEKKASGKKCRTTPAECAVSPPTFRQKVQEVRGQIVDCDDGVELITRLDALLDLSMEFDSERLIPRGQQEPQEAVTGDSSSPPAANRQLRLNGPPSAKALGSLALKSEGESRYGERKTISCDD